MNLHKLVLPILIFISLALFSFLIYAKWNNTIEKAEDKGFNGAIVKVQDASLTAGIENEKDAKNIANTVANTPIGAINRVFQLEVPSVTERSDSSSTLRQVESGSEAHRKRQNKTSVYESDFHPLVVPEPTFPPTMGVEMQRSNKCETIVTYSHEFGYIMHDSCDEGK